MWNDPADWTENRANARVPELDSGHVDTRGDGFARAALRSFIHLGRGGGGFIAFDANTGSFQLIPAGADFFLLGAFAAYAGGGVVANLTLTNWARDKGYGMSSVVGYIPAAVGGQKVALAHSGSTFQPTASALESWKGWWRIVRVDQWGVYFVGVILGMTLPALLYVTFISAGSDIRGLGIAAALAQAVATQKGAIFGVVIAVLGVWILFKAQLDILEGMTRAITDILWTGSNRIRFFLTLWLWSLL